MEHEPPNCYCTSLCDALFLAWPALFLCESKGTSAEILSQHCLVGPLIYSTGCLPCEFRAGKSTGEYWRLEFAAVTDARYFCTVETLDRYSATLDSLGFVRVNDPSEFCLLDES